MFNENITKNINNNINILLTIKNEIHFDKNKISIIHGIKYKSIH